MAGDAVREGLGNSVHKKYALLLNVAVNLKLLQK